MMGATRHHTWGSNNVLTGAKADTKEFCALQQRALGAKLPLLGELTAFPAKIDFPAKFLVGEKVGKMQFFTPHHHA